ncbi:hypothetical protein MAPG_02808 [Magnaporthiopsis poae ATCC 64411]|uniref:Phytocyanin domain-containing protein n=1 Tax=Magnaporthiopsis poae (strain ATCC 64411 / 73-15) TaxID=644358 RepID=A0A0C4DSD0_MAGP6|nr:hypothetical protein MAPG_02808 [Magnaporthiopsis poae ATCC 64411]
MQMRTGFLAAFAVAVARAAVHRVSVGKGRFTYTPDVVRAAKGDVLEFKFVGGVHDAVTGDFAHPCQPAAKKHGAFSSGVFRGKANTNEVFKVTVNSEDPMLVYCSVPGHCAEGMVMVINPSEDTSIDTVRAAARGKSARAPDGVFGGEMGAPSA